MSDLIAVRGDNETYDLTVAEADGGLVDLTDSTLWFTIKKSRNDKDEAALIQKTRDDGITLLDQVAHKGEATVKLVPGDTQLVIPGTYYFDVQMMTDSVGITTLINGTIDVQADVTRNIGS